MIDVNKATFSNLINQLTDKSELTVESGRRYIKTNDIEKNWLKESKIVDTISVIPNTKAILIEFDSAAYICTIGTKLDSHKYDNVVLADFPLNAGLISVLIGEEHLKLDQKSNELEFYNEIMFQHEDEAYKGHDFQDLLDFLEPINFYSLPKDSVLNNQALKRIMCYVFSKNDGQLILNFNDSVLNTISELSLVGSNNISFNMLLSCLFSTSYRHAFLEVYRLVERLFPISYLKEFHEKSESKLSFLDFSSSLENITSWRPREEDALEKIFDSSASSTEYYFNDFFSSTAELNSTVRYKFFYKLRNSIVHFRASHEEFSLSDDQWNKIILATLFLIDEQYSSYHKILIQTEHDNT